MPITDEQIAAATIAKAFGGELLRVRESQTSDTPIGAIPVEAVDPRRFLISKPNNDAAVKAREQELIRRLQAEAEAAAPYPQEMQQSAPQQQTVVPNAASVPIVNLPHIVAPTVSNDPQLTFFDELSKPLSDQILTTLKRIHLALERIEKLLEDKQNDR